MATQAAHGIGSFASLASTTFLSKRDLKAQPVSSTVPSVRRLGLHVPLCPQQPHTVASQALSLPSAGATTRTQRATCRHSMRFLS
ncbi:MAG: hypothetical protein EBY28_28065 [Betaproteobacteria bacterium]|nr:hypothetical protein [Betaproteobacteria bacterium]